MTETVAEEQTSRRSGVEATLVQCLQAEVDHADLQRSMASWTPSVWEQLEEAARTHGVIGPFYAAVRRASLSHAPPEVAQRLDEAYYGHAAHAAHLADRVAALGTALEQAGITHVFLKGVVLALEAYGKIGLRKSGDVDLLVAPEQAVQAAALLQQHGLQPGHSWSVQDALADPFENHYVFTWAAAGEEIGALELHWALASPSVNRHLPHSALATPQVLARREPLLHRGVPLSRLAAEDQFLFLCLHGAKHRWEMLYLLVDIDRVTRYGRPLDGAELLARAATLGAVRYLEPALLLARRLLHTPLPDDLTAHLHRQTQTDPHLTRLADALQEDWLLQPTDRREKDPGRRHLWNHWQLQAALRTSRRERLRFLAASLQRQLTLWTQRKLGLLHPDSTVRRRTHIPDPNGDSTPRTPEHAAP